jgi:uncharacterized NAD(P)/FAD-binding protein YdhS
MDIANITIIGSGAAATTTLIELFNSLIEKSDEQEKLDITIVEKYPEFWKGIPYGSRSSINALTITTIADFINVDGEKKLFHDWLKSNGEWINYYRLNGGLAANSWLEINLPFIEKNEWDMIYLPRFVFGIYLQNKLLSLLKIVENRNLAKITLIEAEGIDVKLNDDSIYEVTLESSDKKLSVIKTKKLMIAIGSAPVKNNCETISEDGIYTYINDIYEPSVDDNLKLLKNAFNHTISSNEKNLLVIGSNASCIELLYLLNHQPDTLNKINKIVAISQIGTMPNHISDVQLNEYPCTNLDKIKANGDYNIHTLIEATKKDLILATKNGAVVVLYIERIITYTINLMQILDESSKVEFFCIYGPQLTRLIRRSGPAYKSSADKLILSEKLQMLKGSFLSIEPNPDGGILNYKNADNDNQKYNSSFKVIINCTGANDLHNSSSRLIKNLVNKGICKVNLSGKGLLVNDKFEAAPNLYMMGPLLGGNMNKTIHFWHLENVSRLLYLAPYLAKQLIN